MNGLYTSGIAEGCSGNFGVIYVDGLMTRTGAHCRVWRVTTYSWTMVETSEAHYYRFWVLTQGVENYTGPDGGHPGGNVSVICRETDLKVLER